MGKLMREIMREIDRLAEGTVSKHVVFKPGDEVLASGIYAVEHDENNPHHEVTCIKGKKFPPSNKAPHPRYRIVHQAVHIEDHEDHS